MTESIKRFISDNIDELFKIIRELCAIPAPSGKEEERSKYCLRWFWENGMTEAYIDSALNVIYPYGSDSELTVFAAHTDTVFPDVVPMPYVDDGEKIYCPGVGDDTASVAVLMLTAKYFKLFRPNTNGMLFVCNSCEEGLGNLKGTRELFRTFNGRIRRFITFDSASFNSAADRCVGSHRYEVEVLTQGGHSWGKFGNKSSIAALAQIINRIYSIDLPEKDGKKVTYNVGVIEGGTSVNTIAQSAKMVCEYRSDDVKLLQIMQEKFADIFTSAKSDGIKVNVKLIGERPCERDVKAEDMQELRRILDSIVMEATGEKVNYYSSSTDCNIPLSLGIPSICVGVYVGGGAHTREEWIDKANMPTGLELGIRLAIGYSK